MNRSLNTLNHRLQVIVKRELGPEYIRLFAPYFFSHGIPAGISGMVVGCTAILSLLMPLEDMLPLPLFFIIGIAVGVFAYAFPFQNMLMGKADHLSYFKFFGVLCTAIVVAAVFLSGPTTTSFIEKYYLFIPVFIGVLFCVITRTKKFAAMLAYQQKLWAIKHRLIEEDKALIAKLTPKQRSK